MDADLKKVAIYTRVSTEDQAKEGFSLDAQLDKLRSYCKARDWVVVEEYIDDGYSGRYVKRPAYKKMMTEKFKDKMLKDQKLAELKLAEGYIVFSIPKNVRIDYMGYHLNDEETAKKYFP